jgi:carbonic anhydrase
VNKILNSIIIFDWSSNKDQQEWNYLFPACNGTLQSPININTKTAVKNPSLTLDLFNYWIMFTNNSAQNIGHTGL